MSNVFWGLAIGFLVDALLFGFVIPRVDPVCRYSARGRKVARLPTVAFLVLAAICLAAALA